MNPLKDFNDKCMNAYLKQIQQEPMYNDWRHCMVLKINGVVQEQYPLVRVVESTRTKVADHQMSQTAYEEYLSKVQYYLELENAMTKMNVFGMWVRHSGLFNSQGLREVLNPEEMLNTPDVYLENHLSKFPPQVRKDVKEIVGTMQTWQRLMEYL